MRLKDEANEMLKTKNKAFRAAFRKGYDARNANLPLKSCPYEDKRGGKYDHVITFSRAFIHYWELGWGVRNEELKRRARK